MRVKWRYIYFSVGFFVIRVFKWFSCLIGYVFYFEGIGILKGRDRGMGVDWFFWCF